jgi:hypothetical protein
VAGDVHRASAKLRRAAELLEDFAADFLRFNVEGLRGSVASCRHRLEELGESGITRFETTRIPRIELLTALEGRG